MLAVEFADSKLKSLEAQRILCTFNPPQKSFAYNVVAVATFNTFGHKQKFYLHSRFYIGFAIFQLKARFYKCSNLIT